MKTQEFKQLLIAKADELRQTSVSKDEIAIERNPEVFDEIQRTVEREMALTALSRNWKVTSQVREALERIDEDTFGICVDCEEPIGERRLKAIPWASRCIRCQENADRMVETFEMPEAA